MAKLRETFVDYYKVMGLSTGAVQHEIRTAYMRLAKTFHPDVNGGDTAKMQQLNAAYLTLRDPSKRRVYDLLHQTHTGTSPLFYHTSAGIEEGLTSKMSDDEIDEFINSVYREVRAEQSSATRNPFARAWRKISKSAH